MQVSLLFQADLQRWKNAEEDYNAANMEDDTPQMRNTVVSVPICVTLLVSTIRFVFGDTAQIHPDYPTASQAMPVSMIFFASFSNPATRANAGLPSFASMTSEFSPGHLDTDTLFFTISKLGEAQ